MVINKKNQYLFNLQSGLKQFFFLNNIFVKLMYLYIDSDFTITVTVNTKFEFYNQKMLKTD